MRIPFLAIAMLSCFLVAPSIRADDRLDFHFINNTPVEILDVDLDLQQTSGEPRRSITRVNLLRDQSYRIGIQGVVSVSRIRIVAANAYMEFADLSGLVQTGDMYLGIEVEDGVARLRQSGGPDNLTGQAETAYVEIVTDANRPNAIPLEDALDADTLDEIREMVREAVEDNAEDAKTAELPAGPIWNNDHAKERCPEVVAEYNEQHGDDANMRWTGHWTTTVPGEMSVCNCTTGAADLAGTLFPLQDGKALAFPIEWEEYVAAGYAMPVSDDSDALAIMVRMPLEEGDMFDWVLEECLKGGQSRPLISRLERRQGDDEDIKWTETEDDAQDAADKLGESLRKALEEENLRDFFVIIVGEKMFDEVKEGKGEITPARGVLIRCGQETLETIVLQDCSDLVKYL